MFIEMGQAQKDTYWTHVCAELKKLTKKLESRMVIARVDGM